MKSPVLFNDKNQCRITILVTILPRFFSFPVLFDLFPSSFYDFPTRNPDPDFALCPAFRLSGLLSARPPFSGLMRRLPASRGGKTTYEEIPKVRGCRIKQNREAALTKQRKMTQEKQKKRRKISKKRDGDQNASLSDRIKSSARNPAGCRSPGGLGEVRLVSADADTNL